MLFPKDFPDKLRSSILVSEVVGKKVKLKSRGREFHGLCPFHNEKSPSFTVNDQKEFYHCFGCSAHGNVISFVMQSEGLEFKDAVVKLANDFGIQIPQVGPEDVRQVEAEQELARDYAILEKICKFFEKNLHGEPGFDARSYLQKRRLNSAIAKKFRLGWAQNSYESLTDFLKAEGFAEAEIVRTGAINRNDKNKVYDKFRNRVIFPITDKKNRVIAFGGRSLGEEMPKYLNSSETEFFKKNQTLYNFFLARKAIFDKGFAVVVEGYMDVISLVANGIENVVAGLGTAITSEHLKELFRVTDKVIICLDGDDAGVRAAKRVSEIALPLINAKKSLNFVFLPEKMDPDDFVKTFGREELEKSFAAAIPLSEALFEFALLDLGIDHKKKMSAENKAKMEANLTMRTEAILDPASKKYFSLSFKDRLFFWGRNGGKNQEKFTSGLVKKTYHKSKNNPAEILGQRAVALMIKYPDLADFRNEDFDIRELHFSSEAMTQLKDSLIEMRENNSQLDCEGILVELKNIASSEDLAAIKNILASLGGDGLDSAILKFRVLLLRDLLFQVDQQYKESLSKVDEIETGRTAISDQKIKEIFDYKNLLEQRILLLEKDI